MLSSAMPRNEMRFLWMDDEGETVRNYAQVIMKRRRVSFDFAESISDAWRMLETRQYAGFVVDCRMSEHDDAMNGAVMLLDVNARSKAFPTFVYSAFLEDPKYATPVSKSYALAVESKAGTFQTPLEKDPFFVRMLQIGGDYWEVAERRPERIEFNDYARNPERFAAEVEVHWRKHHRWIRRDMEQRNLSWVVICGEEIVDGSSNPLEFPPEEKIRALGEDNNLVPFAYSLASFPEDQPLSVRSRWSKTAIGRGDTYPCVQADLDGHVILDDFDTGAASTFVSDDVFPKGAWNFWAESDTPHLGRAFEYYTRRTPVTLLASDGAKQTRSLPLIVVRAWQKSSFVAYNLSRKALFGRDLLRAFDVEVTLHAPTRETSVRIIPAADK